MLWLSLRRYCSVFITGGQAWEIVEAVLIGVLLILFYIHAAALWPVVLGHYLTALIDFGL
jgi:hypothetical protein